MIELDDEESENTEEVKKSTTAAKAAGENVQSQNSQGRQEASDGGVENVEEEELADE